MSKHKKNKFSRKKKEAIRKAWKERQESVKKEWNAEGIDKIEYEIANLENVVSLAKYDLENSGRGNQIIERKKRDAEARLVLKRQELQDLLNKQKNKIVEKTPEEDTQNLSLCNDNKDL